MSSCSEDIKSKDGTIWSQVPRRFTGKRAGQHVLHVRGGPKQLIMNRADSFLDVFFEIWGHSTLNIILQKTIEEARRQGDQLSMDELHAFLGWCLIRGVIKGRDEPLHSF